MKHHPNSETPWRGAWWQLQDLDSLTLRRENEFPSLSRHLTGWCFHLSTRWSSEEVDAAWQWIQPNLHQTFWQSVWAEAVQWGTEHCAPLIRSYRKLVGGYCCRRKFSQLLNPRFTYIVLQRYNNSTPCIYPLLNHRKLLTRNKSNYNQ